MKLQNWTIDALANTCAYLLVQTVQNISHFEIVRYLNKNLQNHANCTKCLTFGIVRYLNKIFRIVQTVQNISRWTDWTDWTDWTGWTVLCRTNVFLMNQHRYTMESICKYCNMCKTIASFLTMLFSFIMLAVFCWGYWNCLGQSGDGLKTTTRPPPPPTCEWIRINRRISCCLAFFGFWVFK